MEGVVCCEQIADLSTGLYDSALSTTNCSPRREATVVFSRDDDLAEAPHHADDETRDGVVSPSGAVAIVEHWLECCMYVVGTCTGVPSGTVHGVGGTSKRSQKNAG
jgi:hypothetical protein